MTHKTIGWAIIAAMTAGSVPSTATAQEAGALPAPRYEIRMERSVMIPMRDGTRQSANIYFPVGTGEKLPVILLRTPYGKDKQGRPLDAMVRAFAAQGYAFVVADVRGRHESQGKFMPQLGDAEDGYDTVQWLAGQDWSNGKVGMIGCSYRGDVQIFAAGARPPALKAIVPQAAGSSIGSADGEYKYFAARVGGAIEFAQNVAWFYKFGPKVYYGPPEGLSREEFLANVEFMNTDPTYPPADYNELWWHLPVSELMASAGGPPNDFTDIATRPVTDKWWDQFPYVTDEYRSDVPALHVNSWYDFGARETIWEFEQMRHKSLSKEARENQYLMMGPTTHCLSELATENTVVGERDMGDARYDFYATYLAWFDHWLRDGRKQPLDLPRVTYFLMGKNEWRTSDEWPVTGTRMRKLYLTSGGDANSRFGDGVLTFQQPSTAARDQFVYDPGMPVPTKGGPACCIGPSSPMGSFDQREVELRHDVLVYSTPPLRQGVEVTGKIDVVLHVSSDAKDTDFTAKLVDVYPDGRAFNVTDGILRARYRDGQEKAVMMQPGKVYQLTLDLEATSNWFGPGHQIRLEVSSSNFPRFDRNLNTGGNNHDETVWQVARNTVHHGGVHASYILLPVVEQ